MPQLTAGCLCGNVRLTASGSPYRVGLCHCLDCRKHHGALFHASAVFPQEAVAVEGETRDHAGRFFCPRCGSSVFGRSADEIEVHLGSLDAPNQLTPTYELWTLRRESWLPPFPHMQHYERNRDAQSRAEPPRIAPGRYRHHKGQFYEVIGVARHSETQEWQVVYKALYADHGLWVRPAAMFTEWVEVGGQRVPRFERADSP